MRSLTVCSSFALMLSACSDSGDGSSGSCPSFDDCVSVCGEGNVASCSCPDGSSEILCKDGSSSGGGGDDGGDGGGDGGGGDDGGGSGGGDGSGDGGGDDGGGDDGGGDGGGTGDDGGGTGDDGGGGTGDDGSTGGGAPDCADLTPPAADQWGAMPILDNTPGFSWFWIEFSSGHWSALYTYKTYQGGLPYPVTPQASVTTDFSGVNINADPIVITVKYDDGQVVYTWAATGGTATLTEAGSRGAPVSGYTTNVTLEAYEDNAGTKVLVSGCDKDFPDISWDELMG